MKYICSSCGHKDIYEAFYGDVDPEREFEDWDELEYVTCPQCGDTYTENCLTEVYS